MRTRLKLRPLNWELPRSSEGPMLRRYMKRISCKARRANDHEIIREELIS